MTIPQYAQSGYGTYLKKQSSYLQDALATSHNTGSTSSRVSIGGNRSSTSSSKNGVNKGTSRLRKNADAITDYNMWTALAKASMNATAEWFDSMTERRGLEAQATGYLNQVQTSQMNATLVDNRKELAELDVRSACNEVYNQYFNGQIQAFEQGLQDAQTTASQQAQSASSGVRMNSGSKAEVDKSNRVSAEINQKIIQRNTESNASNARQQMYAQMRQLSDLDLQKANYIAQGYVAMGNYQAMKIQAKAIKPLEQVGFAFAESMASSISNMGGMGGGFGGK
jgi:hypothetical protein